MIKSVLIPGSGAPAGINTIKSLKKGGFSGKITATDSNELSAGFYLADTHQVLPTIDSSDYFDELTNLVTKNNIEVLMPSSGFDIIPFSQHKKELSELNATAVVSDMQTIENCTDKLKTFEILHDKFELPFTTTDSSKINQFPIFAKPRFGKGGRDNFVVENEEDLKYLESKFDSMIFQELLPGKELTIDLLCDLDTNPIIAIPRLRLQVKGGISVQGKIIRDEKIESACMDIAKTVGIRGPCCIQMKESQNGTMKLVEINPRFGGGTIFSTLAGANLPLMVLDLVDKKEVSIPDISEITILRYFEEIISKE